MTAREPHGPPPRDRERMREAPPERRLPVFHVFEEFYRRALAGLDARPRREIVRGR